MSKGTCIVVFADGRRCWREPRYGAGWCVTCYGWSVRNQADPQGRHGRRPNGDVMALLRSAATAEGPECIILDGYEGRPRLRYGGKWMNASRVVWILAHGDPGDLMVLHSCNGGSGLDGCVSIAHLYLGDSQQNADDKVAAGRSVNGHVPGELNGRAVLTEEDVAEIRRRFKKRHPVNGGQALAAEFGVTTTQISRIVNGQCWAHSADG